MTAAPALQQRDAIFASNRAVGRLTLSVKWSEGASRRASVYEDGPLRVRCPGPPAAELEAVIVNTAGAVAGGDRLQIDVAVQPEAGLVVTSAAAEKIYRTHGPDASIAVTLKVAGRLAWLPQDTILFDRAGLRRSIDVELEESGELLMAEALVFGRAEMGEQITLGRLSDRWRIRRNGRLVYAETLRLDGAVAERLQAKAVAKGGLAVASLVAVPGDDSVVETIRAQRDRFRGEVGASAWNGVAVARFCAADGATLRHDLMIVLTSLRGRALPRLWLS